MRYFMDERYPGERIPENQIKRDYGRKVADGEIDPSEVSFSQYVRNCMSSEGGTLSEVLPEEKKLGSYSFMIRETLTLHVTVEAESFEKAQEEVARAYDTGEFNLDRNCYAGAEFRPCCSKCESDFDVDGDGLREVNCGTPLALLLCDRCVDSMEDGGELTRCDSCQNLFSPSRIKVNPENNVQEICPDCGEIWCD